MKRVLAFLLAAALYTVLIPVPFAAGTYFSAEREYDGRFEDAGKSDWFYEAVTKAYEFGMISGISETKFAPAEEVTLAQILAIASKLRLALLEEEDCEQGGVWYQGYADYAKENGFHPPDNESYDEPPTRGEVAAILVNALPPKFITPLNAVDGGAIPDVGMDDPNAAAVYTLYRAGIFAGINERGSFLPEKSILRSEIAAIITKIIEEHSRTRKNLANPGAKILSSVEVAEKCSPAVFLIELFDAEDDEGGDEPYATGSGFFITSDGVAVTSHHVIGNADRAVITTYDGERHDIAGIYSCDEDLDLAIIQIDGTGFPALELGDSMAVKQGERVYALGSPHGYDNSFAEGVIANAGRDVDGLRYIQSSIIAPAGNSGGPILNSKGQVISVATWGWDVIDFSVPVDMLNGLERIKLNLLGGDPPLIYYPGCGQALHFGTYMRVKHDSLRVEADGSVSVVYHKRQFSDDEAFALAAEVYHGLLLENGMSAREISNGWRFTGKSEVVELTVSGSRIFITTQVEPVYFDEYETVLDMSWFFGIPEYVWEDYGWDYDDYFYAAYESDIYNFRTLSLMLRDYYVPALETAGFALVGEGGYGYSGMGYVWYDLTDDSGIYVELMLDGDRDYAWIEIYIYLLEDELDELT